MLIKIIQKYWKQNLLALFLTSVESGGIIVSTVFLAQIMNHLIEGDSNGFIFFFLASLFAWGIALFFGYIKQRYVEYLKQQQIFDLREQIVLALSHSSYTNFHQKNPNEYTSWLTNDMNILEEQGLGNLYGGMSSATLLTFSAIAILNFHWILLVLSILITTIMFLLSHSFKHRLDDRNSNLSQAFETYLSRVDEWLKGFDLLLTYNKVNMIVEKLGKVNKQVKSEKIILKKEQTLLNTLIRLIAVFSQYLIILITGILILLGRLSVGTIFSIGDLTGNFFGNTSFFIEQITNFFSSVTITKKMEDFLSSQEAQSEAGQNRYSFSHEIVVVNLKYHYDKQTIEIPNMTFSKKGKYAIIGKSGSGKSTFLNILVRNLPDYTGEIWMDHCEISEIDLVDYRSNIVYVPQKSYLFDMSLEDNLTLENVYSNQEIERVIKEMDLEKQSTKLKDGLGIQGEKLSGGQAQRVALGRGLLHAKDVLIIDEGTSSLDSKTSFLIEKAILMNEELTVIFVTHHLNDELKNLFDDIYTFS